MASLVTEWLERSATNLNKSAVMLSWWATKNYTDVLKFILRLSTFNTPCNITEPNKTANIESIEVTSKCIAPLDIPKNAAIKQSSIWNGLTVSIKRGTRFGFRLD